MPKLSSRSTSWNAGPDGGSVVEISLEGFIDAANYAAFEHALEAAHAAGHQFAILDFAHVHYINSTGISALIRFDELYRARRGALCMAGVAKPVGLSMHLLGVTSILSFLKDMEAARAHVRDLFHGRVPLPGAAETEAAPAGGEGERKAPARRRIPLRQRRIPGLDKAKVLVITPAKTRFTRILRLRFNALNGDYHLLHDIREALDKYDEMSPDLVVVDDRSDPKGEFVSRVKIQKERSLTSVIKMYPRKTDVETAVDFKIWENDYLVEPFEVLELFTLTESELTRVPKDKKVFQQQVHFELKTSQENVEKAYKLCDLVIRKSLLLDEDATAFYASVKEGIDNAVQHGNQGDRGKTIDVNLLVDRKKITVIIEDQGKGFDSEYYLSRISDEEAFEKAKKRILEDGVRGGLGILLMAKCSDRIEYSGCGNVLRLEKNL